MSTLTIVIFLWHSSVFPLFNCFIVNIFFNDFTYCHCANNKSFVFTMEKPKRNRVALTGKKLDSIKRIYNDESLKSYSRIWSLVKPQKEYGDITNLKKSLFVQKWIRRRPCNDGWYWKGPKWKLWWSSISLVREITREGHFYLLERK